MPGRTNSRITTLVGAPCIEEFSFLHNACALHHAWHMFVPCFYDPKAAWRTSSRLAEQPCQECIAGFATACLPAVKPSIITPASSSARPTTEKNKEKQERSAATRKQAPARAAA